MTNTPSRSEKLRTRLERIAWKHYQPRTSTNVEAMLDDMMFELSEERERIAGEIRLMKLTDDEKGSISYRAHIGNHNHTIDRVLSIIRGDKE